MQFDSYIVSETKTATTIPLNCYCNKTSSHLSFFKRTAFTLAETLITLTIIGVVAAITIPTLMSKYQKHTYVAGLKEMHSILSSVVQQLPAATECSPGDYECTFNYEYNHNYYKDIKKALPNLLKIEKICDRNNKGAGEIYVFKNSECDSLAKLDQICFDSIITLSNGMQICTDVFSGSSAGVDINGDKGPNEFGRDIFVFEIATRNHNGINAGTILPKGSKLFSLYESMPYWRDGNLCTNAEPAYINSNTQALYCAGRVLEEDTMNY